jgi:hypothetical protein
MQAKLKREPWAVGCPRSPPGRFLVVNLGCLKSLECWKLNPAQQEQLSDRAILRHTRFSSIAQVCDISCELRHQDEIKANPESLVMAHEEQRRQHEGALNVDSFRTQARNFFDHNAVENSRISLPPAIVEHHPAKSHGL